MTSAERTRRMVAYGRQYARILVRLPEPPETFQTRDYDFLDRPTVLVLSANDVLYSVSPGVGHSANVWRVASDAYDVAQRYLESSEFLDCCGATGVKNVGGDLQCSDCGAPVSREDAKRVLP